MLVQTIPSVDNSFREKVASQIQTTSILHQFCWMPSCGNWNPIHIRPQWASGYIWVKYYILFLEILSHDWSDGVSRLTAQRTRTHERVSLFGFWYCYQYTNFGETNRHFRAKLVKISNFHIFKTTASIATKFCTMIKTTKYCMWVVVQIKSKMADGRNL